MNRSTEPPGAPRLIEDISDTARWVAYYRALESERPDAIFRDPFARRLAGTRGEDIVRSLPGARSITWAIAVRTRVIDETILGAIERDGVDVVLSLAAGLDTRPYRLALPGALRWFEADLPPLLAYKARLLAGETPRCALESVAIDLADVAARRALFERIGGRRVLVLTEGLLGYLGRDAVGQLGEDLRAQPGFQLWVTALFSPWIVKRRQRQWGTALKAGNAEIQFAPPEGPAFFRRHGWELGDYRSFFVEGRRLNRGPWYFPLVAPLTRLGPLREPILRSAGIVTLRRREDHVIES